jgi:epoxyqueuosine reductase
MQSSRIRTETVWDSSAAADTDSLAVLSKTIKARAFSLGFDLCGIAPAVPSAFRAEFRSWIERGMHGEMGYMARDPERRLEPELVLPGARSIVVVAMNYYTESEPESPDQAVFARYARGDDYHDVMLPRLKELLAWIREVRPEAEGKCYVDTGPILEREVARRAGIGWFGKNTMLINTRRGSWFLLGELLLTLPLVPDEPAMGGCGTCTRCLDACPTGAIVRPYEVDARRCISYLTIEQKGPIPVELAEKMGNRIFGCDICQEVCPFNERRAVPTDEPAFHPRPSTIRPKLADLLEMTEEEFRAKFKRSPVKRAKWQGLLRNAAASNGNLSAHEESEFG